MTIVIVGAVILILSIWGIAAYWWSFLEIIRGFLPFLGVVLGTVFIGAGIRSSVKKAGEDE